MQQRNNIASAPLAIAVVVVVLLGDVVFGDFARFDFGFVGIGRDFHGVDEFGFETLALLGKFLDAFGVGARRVWKPFDIARLAAGTGPEARANRQADFAGAGAGGAAANACYPSAARGFPAASETFCAGCFPGCRLFFLSRLGFLGVSRLP